MVSSKLQFRVEMCFLWGYNGVDWMICECSDSCRIHEEYAEPDVHWANWGVPEGISYYYVCMTCNKSWVERFWWGRDAVVSQEEETTGEEEE